jgi:hypothetical protein
VIDINTTTIRLRHMMDLQCKYASLKAYQTGATRTRLHGRDRHQLPTLLTGGLSASTLILFERYPQLFHPVAEGVRVHAEKLTGPAGAVNLAVGHTQDPADVTRDDSVEVERFFPG